MQKGEPAMYHVLNTTSFNLCFFLISVLVVLIFLSLHPIATARKQAVNRSAQAFASFRRMRPVFVSTIPASAVPTPAVSWANISSGAEEGTTPTNSSDSRFAGGTAGSTVGCTAEVSDGDTVRVTEADTKTAASEKAPSSTFTAEKAAEGGQNTDDGGESEHVSNTVKTQIREALDQLVSLIKSSEGCPGQIEITDEIGILKSVNSDSLFQTIADCDGQTLSSLLPVINALGPVIQKDDPFALSGLGTAMLFRFFSEYTERHIFRRGLAMYFAMLPESSQNVEAFSRLLGIAKKRLYTATQELQDNGCLLDGAHINQPGAGRTSSAESFESEILPLCIAAGLEESEIILRQQERKAKEAEAAFPDKKENGEAGDKEKENGEAGDKEKESTVETTGGETSNTAGTQDSTPGQAAPEATCAFSDSYTSADTNGGPAFLWKSTATHKEVLDTFESAKPHIEKAIAGLDDMLHSSSFGDTAYLYEIRFLIMSNVQFVTDELEWLNHSEDIVPSNADEASNNTIVSQQITDTFRPILLFRIDLQIRATRQMCVKLLSAMDALDPEMALYHQIRALKKAFKVKPYENYFLWQWNEYRSGVDRIAFLARKFQRDFNALRRQSDSKDGESSEAAAESESGAESNSLESQRSACISAELTKQHSEEALQGLEEVCQCLLPFTSQGAGAPKIQEAYESLLQLTETFQAALQLNLPEDAAAACAARASLVEIVRITLLSCLNLRQIKGTPYKVAERISGIILADGFRNSVAKAVKDIRIFMSGNVANSSATEPECYSAEQNTCPDGTVRPDEMQIPEEQLTSIKQHADEAQATLASLMDRFEKFLGMSSGKRGKRSNEVLKDRQDMKNALDFLTAIREKFSISMDSVWNTRTYTVWNAAVSLVRVLNELGSEWLGKWKNVKKYEVAFNMVRRITASILSDKHQDRINLRFTHLEQAFQAVAAAEDTLSNYIECSNSDDMADWFSQTASLAPDKRAGLIRKLWDEGKDPTDIKVWIDYILGKEYARNYGDPSEDHRCCKITRRELKNAFHYLSGIEKSDTTLWYIVTKQMGYTNRQCAKLDQIGGSHPLRETQYNFIQSQIEAAELGKTLVLSIDTKAFIVLGRLKHDNGRLLCSQGKGVYRVFDHDYYAESSIIPKKCFGSQTISEVDKCSG